MVDISLRNTTIRQLANNIIIVPNAKLASSIVTNFHNTDPTVSVKLEVGVAYDSDLCHVESVALEVARLVMREIPGGCPDFDPVARFHSFGDSAIRLILYVEAIDYVSQFPVRHELLKRLKLRFQQEGIVIPYPIQEVHLVSGMG